MANDPSTMTMNVSLPETLKRYVDGKVSSGIYGSASEFVREAIREKMAREEDLERARAKLEALLIEGLESGPPIRITENYFEEKKAQLLKRLAGKKAKS